MSSEKDEYNLNEEENIKEDENLENNSPSKNNENSQENQIQDGEEEPIEVEVEDRGVNTDELPPEELQRLVDNNAELKEESEVKNIEHEIKKDDKDDAAKKKALIDELNEKDKIFESLVKMNNLLKNKIELSNKKYQEILNKIEAKKKEDIETNLNLQIQELNKSIKANNSETERYKKMIDQLKTKIEFKENLDRVSSIQYILKQETLKNNDLQNELNALKRINKAQEKYIDTYNKENQVTEKLELLDNEIKQNKESIKEYQDKYNRLEKFIRLAHEKILSLEMLIKKGKEPKIENKKLFTKEELKDTLELITNLKVQINDKRVQLNNINKESEAKMHKLLAQNKQIELEYKENEKLNKMLINKKNELKRSIKSINSKNVNSIKLKTKLLKFDVPSNPNKEANNNQENIDLNNKEENKPKENSQNDINQEDNKIEKNEEIINPEIKKEIEVVEHNDENNNNNINKEENEKEENKDKEKEEDKEGEKEEVKSKKGKRKKKKKGENGETIDSKPEEIKEENNDNKIEENKKEEENKDEEKKPEENNEKNEENKYNILDTEKEGEDKKSKKKKRKKNKDNEQKKTEEKSEEKIIEKPDEKPISNEGKEINNEPQKEEQNNEIAEKEEKVEENKTNEEKKKKKVKKAKKK